MYNAAMTETPRLNPDEQPDFTRASSLQLTWLDEDLSLQEQKIKKAMITDWPLKRVVVVGLILGIGVATTISYVAESDVKNAAVTAVLTGMLGLIAATDTLIGRGIDLWGVKQNKKIVKEVAPAVALREAIFDRDDRARLN